MRINETFIILGFQLVNYNIFISDLFFIVLFEDIFKHLVAAFGIFNYPKRFFCFNPCEKIVRNLWIGYCPGFLQCIIFVARNDICIMINVGSDLISYNRILFIFRNNLKSFFDCFAAGCGFFCNKIGYSFNSSKDICLFFNSEKYEEATKH